MAGCALASSAAAPLIQIRRGYQTSVDDLRLSVELDPEGWKVDVRDRGRGRTLYSARRCSLRAAKSAAAEFATFQSATPARENSPESIAQRLEWNEYW